MKTNPSQSSAPPHGVPPSGGSHTPHGVPALAGSPPPLHRDTILILYLLTTLDTLVAWHQLPDDGVTWRQPITDAGRALLAQYEANGFTANELDIVHGLQLLGIRGERTAHFLRLINQHRAQRN